MFSFPPGTEMFQFPGFPAPALCVQAGLTGHDPSRVSPFGDPWIVGWLTPPQGLSQPPTSFIGSRCQGIHRVLFFTCRKDCSRSLWSSQGSPTHRCDGLPIGDRRFHRGWCAAEGVTPSELHKAPSTERVPQFGHIHLGERTRPRGFPERWSCGPPCQLASGSRDLAPRNETDARPRRGIETPERR